MSVLTHVITLIIFHSMIILRSIPWLVDLATINESPVQIVTFLLDPTT